MPPRRPYAAAVCDYEDVIAVKKCAEGTADAAQQRRVLGWIVAISRRWNENYYPDSQRDTDFALGMSKVGFEINRLINMSGKELEELRKRQQTTVIEGPNG